MIPCVAMLAAAVGLPAQADPPFRLEFKWETQNLRILQNPLTPQPSDPRILLECSREGESRFGDIPHRLHEDDPTSRESFLHFAVIYEKAGPSLLIDTNGDRKLECIEAVSLVRHPKDTARSFRTITVHWSDTSPPRERRYRVNVPTALEADPQFQIDLVDIPIARWTKGEHTTLWLLLDGNYNGEFDRRLGDGVLIEMDGAGPIDVQPEGKNFASYHRPIEVPWGVYEVEQLDVSGGFLMLRERPGATTEPAVLKLGDEVPAMECLSLQGEKLRFGAATGSQQVIYFWHSQCSSCLGDAPILASIKKQYPSVRFLGVSFDESPSTVREFLRENGIEWPQCFSGTAFWDNVLSRRFGRKVPSDFVLIGPNGILDAAGDGAEGLAQLLAASVSSEN